MVAVSSPLNALLLRIYIRIRGLKVLRARAIIQPISEEDPIIIVILLRRRPILVRYRAVKIVILSLLALYVIELIFSPSKYSILKAYIKSIVLQIPLMPLVAFLYEC